MVFDASAGVLAKLAAERFVVEEEVDFFDERRDLLYGYEVSGLVVDDCVLAATVLGGDNGFGTGHGFEDGNGETFEIIGGQDEKVGGLHEVVDVIAPAEEFEVFV